MDIYAQLVVNIVIVVIIVEDMKIRSKQMEKIIVEFDKRDFYKPCLYCSNKEAGWCEQSDKEILMCNLKHGTEFKIKMQERE